MSTSTGRRHRESRRSREKRYNDDSYQDRGTPRAAYRTAGGEREGYDHLGEVAETDVDQVQYSSQRDSTWGSEPVLETRFENLSVASDSRLNYTTKSPPYGAAADYPSPYSTAASDSVPSQPAGSTSASTYTAGEYPSYAERNQGIDASNLYSATANYNSAYPATEYPTSSTYSGYEASYQPVASTATYTQSSYTSSIPPYTPSLGQPTELRVSAYPSQRSATLRATSYQIAPSYAQDPQGSTYAAGRDPGGGQFYHQANASPPESSGYKPQQTREHDPQAGGHNPRPGAIQQCKCISCELDGPEGKRPRIIEGNDDRKKTASSSKKTDSSKNKPSSSKKVDASKSKTPSVSKSATFIIQDSSGSGCGALYLSDVTPWPRPRPPPEGSGEREWAEYLNNLKEWEEDWKRWKDTSCPCRYGYFNLDAQWVAGNHVRKWLDEGDVPGASPPNPEWENNTPQWKAPEQAKPGESSDRRYPERRRRH